MRLVRDEEPMDVDQVEQSPTVRRARGKKIKPVMVELPDGVVDATEPEVVAATVELEDSPTEAVLTSTESNVAEDAAADSEGFSPNFSLAKLEALLFSTHHPLTAGRLAELLELDSTKPIRGAIRELNKAYADSGRAFNIEQVAGGYQMLTLPEHVELLKQMHQKEIDAKLGKAAMETLAIIAYKQPILRAEIEGIRGVACGETIRNLMEKHLVKIAGRAEEPGRPILYGTTKRFLEIFGLNSIKDLPQPENGAGPGDAGRSLQARIDPPQQDAPAAQPVDNGPEASELQPESQPG